MNRYAVGQTRLLSLVALGAALVWVMAALATWGGLANGPRFGSPWTTYGYGQTLLFDGSVQLAAVIGAIALQFAAGIIGYAWIIRPLWGYQRLAAPIWLFFAGVIPGSLLLIALTRLVTLVLPNSLAPIVVSALTLVACTFIFLNRRLREPKPLFRITGRQVLASLIALGVALVFSVHVDRGHVVGEGSVWFINQIFLSDTYGVGTSGRWPLISQHYDEAAFLYPVVYGLLDLGSHASGTLTAVYWVMLAFGRVGMVVLSYVAIRGLRVDRLSACILVAFVCGASLSLNPMASRLLFDSLSPLSYTLHISRFLIAVLPVVLISAMAARAHRISGPLLALAALLGIGLSSMAFHVVLVLFWGLAVALLTVLAPNVSRAESAWRTACSVCIVLLGSFAFAYGMQAIPDVAQAGALLGSALISMALCARLVIKERTSPPAEEGTIEALAMMSALCAGCAFGLLLLGNVFLNSVWPFLSNLSPWSGMSIVDRFSEDMYRPVLQLRQSPYCDEGYYWGFRRLTGHCGSFGMLARTYGLALVSMTAVIAWFLWKFPSQRSSSDGAFTLSLWGMLLCLIAHPLGFVLYDFISAVGEPSNPAHQLSVWLRSRLLEPWFYGGILLALALFLRSAEARHRVWLQSVLMVCVALFAFVPLVLPAQLTANFSYLISTLLGL